MSTCRIATSNATCPSFIGLCGLDGEADIDIVLLLMLFQNMRIGTYATIVSLKAIDKVVVLAHARLQACTDILRVFVIVQVVIKEHTANILVGKLFGVATFIVEYPVGKVLFIFRLFGQVKSFFYIVTDSCASNLKRFPCLFCGSAVRDSFVTIYKVLADSFIAGVVNLRTWDNTLFLDIGILRLKLFHIHLNGFKQLVGFCLSLINLLLCCITDGLILTL